MVDRALCTIVGSGVPAKENSYPGYEDVRYGGQFLSQLPYLPSVATRYLLAAGWTASEHSIKIRVWRKP